MHIPANNEYCQLCGQCFPISYVIDNSDKQALMKILPLTVESSFMHQSIDKFIPELAFFNAIDWNMLICVNCAPSKIIWGTKIYKKHFSCRLFYLYSENNIIYSRNHMKECPRNMLGQGSSLFLHNITDIPKIVPTLVRRSQL